MRRRLFAVGFSCSYERRPPVMAEWGQGDERWIVQDRKDGANVNQWHWKEKDCIGWARQRFNELLLDATLVAGTAGVTAHINKVDSVEGEAFLNIRKKKMIVSYELCITASFIADYQKAGAATETVEGKV
jgi:activator of HSP90 ATPase